MAARLASRFAEVVVGVIVVVTGGGGVGCAPAPPSCPERTQYTVGSTPVGSEPGVIDFGVVAPGLSSTIRVSFVVGCNLFVDGASAGDGDGGVFVIDDFVRGDPDEDDGGEAGAVSVSAHPTDEHEARGQLHIAEDGDGVNVDLVVNAGR